MAGVVALAALIAACNPAVEVAFNKSSISEIETMGFRNDVPTACSCTDSDVVFTLPLTSQANTIIDPGSVVEGTVLEIGTTMTADSVEFSQARLFPAPDQPCAVDNDCATGFTCAPLSTNAVNNDLVCQRDITINVKGDTMRFQRDDLDATKLALMVMIANGGSIAGFNPAVGIARAELRTDPTGLRVSGAQEVVSRIAADGYRAGNEICIASFAGEGRSSVSFAPGLEQIDPRQAGACFLDAEDNSALLTQVLGGVGGAVNSNGARANWGALLAGIDRFSEADPTAERQLLFFTDGPDDGSVAAAGETFEQVVNQARAQGVQIHIVHLDNQFALADSDNDGVPDRADNCREVPNASQEDSDSSCGGFGQVGDGACGDACDEDIDDDGQVNDADECPYLSNQTCGGDTDGDFVGNDQDGCPNEAEDRDGFNDDDGCVDADNDQDGIPDTVDACPDLAEDASGDATDGCPDEVGPSDLFAQLACETGGSYQYNLETLQGTPGGLQPVMRALATGVPGRFEVGVAIPTLVDVPDGAYTVAASVSLSYAGRTRTLVPGMDPAVNDRASQVTFDHRAVVFKRSSCP